MPHHMRRTPTHVIHQRQSITRHLLHSKLFPHGLTGADASIVEGETSVLRSKNLHDRVVRHAMRAHALDHDQRGAGAFNPKCKFATFEFEALRMIHSPKYAGAGIKSP